MRVLVIGAGLAGLCTAWFLRKHGVAVTIIDRAESPARETSFANGGMLTPSLSNPWNDSGMLWEACQSLWKVDSPVQFSLHAVPGSLLWGLHFLQNCRRSISKNNFIKNVKVAGYSLELLAALSRETEIKYDHASTGTIRLHRSHKALQKARKTGEFLAEWNIPSQSLDPKRLIDLEPALAPVAANIAGATYYPRDECGDAYRFCQDLSHLMRQQGVEFVFDVQVKSFRTRDNTIQAVVCDGAEFTSDTYVLAAGSYSPLIARSLRLSLPIRPVKGISITVPRWTKPAGAPVIPVLDESLHTAVVPLGKHIRVVGKAIFGGYDLATSSSVAANLQHDLLEIFPQAASELAPNAQDIWSGLRAVTTDGVPILGRTGLKNLYLNTGHGHLGWTMATGTGALVADMIVGKPPRLSPDDYALARFE